MATCVTAEFTNNALCINAESFKPSEKQYYGNYDEVVAAIEAGTITVVDNAITEFSATNLLEVVYNGLRFDSAQTGTSARTGAGGDKFTHSVNLQAVTIDPTTELEVSKMAAARIVVFTVIEGATLANKPNSIKVYGLEAGLRATDGGIVNIANANSGETVMAMATDSDQQQYESYVRHSFTPTTTADTFAERIALLEAAVKV